MMNQDEKPGFFDNPKRVQWIIRGLYVCCGILVLLDFLIHRHTVHAYERLPAFYAFYGFLGCVVLVLIAKEMRKVLMRKEDYYDDVDH